MGREVAAWTSAEWDITDPTQAQRFISDGDLVVNCAAYTDVDGAEADPDRAYAVNAVGPENVASACARVGAEMIHISTDYVFGGDQDSAYDTSDHTNPLNVYGRSKLAGELAVLAALPDAHVVRTSWVYTGGDGKDFVAAVRRLAAGDGVVEMVSDQVGSPTYVADLVAGLLELADSPTREPVLHASNAGAASRFDQAVAVFTELGADPERIRPVKTADRPRPAVRPTYSALSGAQWAAAGLTPLRDWRHALHASLADAR